jgi:3-oxoacyl-[acyl-carrier-protein] synthase III
MGIAPTRHRARRKGLRIVKPIAAEIQSLGIEMPTIVRTNEYWRVRYPHVVREIEEKGRHKVWTPPNANVASLFLDEMARYLNDPFRGTIERRVLDAGQTSLSLECGAARRALDAAGIGPRDIDITLCVSFLGDHAALGNGAFLARALELPGPAWNVESTCAGSLVALDLAASLIGSGRAQRVLVVTSCDYSRRIDETDVLSWTSGDGAAAFVVGRASEDHGILGSHFIPTTSTCGSLYFEYCELAPNEYGVRMQCTADAGRLLRETSEDCIRRSCEKALEAAGMTIDDVQHFIFATPTAWYANFCARSLRIDPNRCVDTYPQYANIGPVCWLANLHEHARRHGIRAGDIVLLCAIGSVSSAGAIVARFGAMNLG